MLAITVVCVSSVFFINPQYVNISTLYCGSALIMAMIAVSAADTSAIAIGLLYAALVALKPTFVAVVGLHWVALTFSMGIRWAIRTSVAAGIFLSPWVFLHLPHYLAALKHPLPTPTPVAATWR